MSEIHLFILWENARAFQEKILDDIASHFTILKKYEVTWTPSLVVSNYTRFCGARLGNNLQFKIDNCGTGEFLVVVVRDETPTYETKQTFHGLADVNIKMFEAKQRYREWTGGGIKVHATDNILETRHDIILIIGKPIEYFEKLAPQQTTEILHKDLEGANGWESREQFLLVLKNIAPFVTKVEPDDIWLILNCPSIFRVVGFVRRCFRKLAKICRFK